MPGPSVAELVTRAKRGEAAAFDQLVRRHLRAAYVVALAVLGRPADADDVAQEAFVTALERLEDCRDPSRFSGWLIQIVRNRSLNALDKRKLRDSSGEPTDVAVPGHAGDVVLRARLIGALATLSEQQREIVLLHDLDGWTHAELADALGISEVNCRQQLFTARRALRAELASLAPEERSHGTGN
ncbi:MAG TPA: sigma-70 family RNA polymerase sigma factor [Kofleriaceae bacterium]